MMYPYLILSDETEITHSQIIEENGVQKLRCILSVPQSMDLIPRAVCFLRTNGSLMRDFLTLRWYFLMNSFSATPICFTGTQHKEESAAPNLF